MYPEGLTELVQRCACLIRSHSFIDLPLDEPTVHLPVGSRNGPSGALGSVVEHSLDSFFLVSVV